MQRFYNTIFFFVVLLSAHCAIASEGDCIEKNIAVYQWGVRHYAAMPASLSVPPGDTLEACIKLTGIGTKPLEITPKHYDLSVNGGPFITGKTLQIFDNDVLRIKLLAPAKHNDHKVTRLEFFETDKTMRRDVLRIAWQVQTDNSNTLPTTWYVGSDKRFTQVSQVLAKVRSGDTIVLNKAEVFEPFEIKFVSGSKENPITLTSNAESANERPIISGGVPRFGWAVGLRSSHFWVVENIVIKDAAVCFRNESHGTVLKQVLIKGCHIGVMGTDYNAGSLTIAHSEITESGGREAGKKWGHPIYVASDPHTFPQAQLVLAHNFIHDNQGNNVKSRYEKSLIHNNWIEAGNDNQARYVLELIGYDGHYDFTGQEYVVQNNFLIHNRYGLGSRVGGDGKGPSRGSVSFENNLFIIGSGFSFPLIRTFQGLGELNVLNNSVAYTGEAAPITFVQDELNNTDWVKGKAKISVIGNTVNQSVTLLTTLERSSKADQSLVEIEKNRNLEPLQLSRDILNSNRPIPREYVGDIGLN